MFKIKSKLKNLVLSHLFKPQWYSIINPYFIARFNLFKQIKIFSKKYFKENEKILDVGCDIKPYKDLFKTSEYIGIDIKSGDTKKNSNTQIYILMARIYLFRMKLLIQ